MQAVNYQYRGPTKIDFRGTVLLPHAKGHATVESREGGTAIDARFEGVAAPARFGSQYLTYVLWAITPEGAPKNLGEVLADGSDHAKLHATTNLQTFGLIVTAEPHYAVRQPGDVVVMENLVRPDTVGKVQPIQARYELLPRGQYTYTVPSGSNPPEGSGPKVSLDRYNTIVAVYQAENAVQIAKAAGAERYAPDTYARAVQSLGEARALEAKKPGDDRVVTEARQAAQIAEDARAITDRKKQGEDLAEARAQAERDRAAANRAIADTQRASAEADAARAQVDQDRAAARRGAERGAQPAPEPARQPRPAQASPSEAGRQKTELRLRLLKQLNGEMEARDTPRGLVVLVPDADFDGTALRPAIDGNLTRVASVLAAYPGLRVNVEGNSDTNDEAFSQARAAAVGSALTRAGLAAGAVSARGLGNSRPAESNSSPSGRARNRRVEIVISGDPIGDMAYWDESYSVAPR